MRNIKFLLLALIISACNSVVDTPKKEIDFKNLKAEDFSTSDMIKSIGLIAFESVDDAMLGDLLNVKMFNDHVYVLESNRGVLNKFDLNGKHIASFGKEGKGPGEYLRAEDFLIDPKKGTIEILSLQNRKIFIYDENGNFLNSFDVKASAFSFVKDELNNYWLNKGVFKFDEDGIGNYRISLVSH